MKKMLYFWNYILSDFLPVISNRRHFFLQLSRPMFNYLALKMMSIKFNYEGKKSYLGQSTYKRNHSLMSL